MTNIYEQPVDIMEVGKIKTRFFAEDIFQLGYQLLNSLITATVARLGEDPKLRTDLNKAMSDFDKLHDTRRKKYHSQYAGIDASDNILKIRKYELVIRSGEGDQGQLRTTTGTVRDIRNFPNCLLLQLIPLTIHQILSALQLRYMWDDYYRETDMTQFRKEATEISLELVRIISKRTNGQVASKAIITRFCIDTELITSAADNWD